MYIIITRTDNLCWMRRVVRSLGATATAAISSFAAARLSQYLPGCLLRGWRQRQGAEAPAGGAAALAAALGGHSPTMWPRGREPREPRGRRAQGGGGRQGTQRMCRHSTAAACPRSSSSGVALIHPASHPRAWQAHHRGERPPGALPQKMANGQGPLQQAAD